MQWLDAAALWAAVALFSSCASPTHRPQDGRPASGAVAMAQASPPALQRQNDLVAGSTDAPADAVVLVTLDGVRWQEVFQGVDAQLAARDGMPRAAVVPAATLMPNVRRLFFDGGVVLGAPGRGAGIGALGPRYVSLPAYVELMTGARSTCWSNDCQPIIGWTVAEELRGDAPGTAAVFASWERIAAVFPDPGTLALHAGRDSGDEPLPHPGNGGYRPDRITARRALAHLVEHRPRFLWLALGDTDEWGHRNDYRGYLDALRAADAVIGEIAAHLAEMPGYGERAALVVTTDHGRDDGFADHGGKASADVWLMARGAGVANIGAVATAKRRHLRDVAPTVLSLLGRTQEACEECGEVLAEVLAAPAAPVAAR
ncbi:MAG: alkaline phosphatase family protein [Polyangiaceae bacterium]